MKKILVIFVFCTFLPGLAFTWSDPIYIIDSEHNDYTAITSFTPNESLFAVWFSAWATHYYDVSYAQVAEDGTLTIPPTRIFTEDGVDDRAPTVAVDSQGHAHVFWRRWTGGDYDIWYAQIDTADGSYIVEPKDLIKAVTVVDIFLNAVVDGSDNVHLLYCGYVWNGEEGWESPLYAKLDSSGNLLFSDKIVADDPAYDAAYFDKGIGVDSDGNAHIAYDIAVGSDDWTVIYRKLDGNDGTPLTPLIDLGYPTKAPSYDRRPSVCVDYLDHVHVSYIHYTGISYIVHVILDKDGNIISEPCIVYTEEDGVELVASNFFVTEDDRLFLFCNCDDGIVVFEFNTDGELVGEPNYLFGVLVGHFYCGPTGAVGTSGYIRVVGENHVDSGDYDILYVHQIDDTAADDPVLSADSASDGILLSWREEGELVGSTWRLERDGERLVNLSGDALYRYLDRDAEPNITHFYTLEATLPDGSVRTFGPVEATWPGSDAARFTLYTPYPCPATDRVTLSYYLPEGTKNVELSLYDLSGRLVASYVSIP
ncbi:MAG: hypothetical protein NTW26_00460, partial [bacterium]|nr:hypothetical protein [bacterium]